MYPLHTARGGGAGLAGQMGSASLLLSTLCREMLCYDEGRVATVGRGIWAEW